MFRYLRQLLGPHFCANYLGQPCIWRVYCALASGGKCVHFRLCVKAPIESRPNVRISKSPRICVSIRCECFWRVKYPVMVITPPPPTPPPTCGRGKFRPFVGMRCDSADISPYRRRIPRYAPAIGLPRFRPRIRAKSIADIPSKLSTSAIK